MVKRYEPCCPIMDEISMGDYVRFEDYDKLREAARALLKISILQMRKDDEYNKNVVEHMKEVLKNG